MEEKKEMVMVEQAMVEAQAAVKKAAASGKFLVAVWQVKDGKVELTHYTTFNFPRGDFLPAVGHLALELHSEVMSAKDDIFSPPTVPLPAATMKRFGIPPVHSSPFGKDSPVKPEPGPTGPPPQTDPVGRDRYVDPPQRREQNPPEESCE